MMRKLVLVALVAGLAVVAWRVLGPDARRYFAIRRM